MTTVGVFAAIFDNERRILCVKRAYGPQNWTTPGGRMESGESPIAALEREVLEETGYVIRAGRLLGAYAATFKDDLVLSIEAEIIGREAWESNAEIAEVGFFAQDVLPQPMHPFTAARIRDAFEGRTGIIRVLETPMTM
jgi:8-oxo-dGTP diphosphatase